jgi:hypothetical protein
MSRENIMAMVVLLGAFNAVAWGDGGGLKMRPERMAPPPDAIDACKNKSEGDSVTFTTPRGDSIKATCKKFNGQLAAVPDGPPPGMGEPPDVNVDTQQGRQ